MVVEVVLEVVVATSCNYLCSSIYFCCCFGICSSDGCVVVTVFAIAVVVFSLSSIDSSSSGSSKW